MPQSAKERRRRLQRRQAVAYDKHGPGIMFAANSSKIVGVMPFPRNTSEFVANDRHGREIEN